MKRMKFLMGVLACFLITLTFGTSKVSAAYTVTPDSYFDSITVDGPKGNVTKTFNILDTMKDPNADENPDDATSCITFGGDFCINDVITLHFKPKTGVTVDFGDGQTYNQNIEYTREYTVTSETLAITFTAQIGGGQKDDFSITIDQNKACPVEKTYCEKDPSKDEQIKQCISDENGKDEAACIAELCPEEKTYCEKDPSKDPEIKQCIEEENDKDEAACIAELCPEEKTYCKEDPSKDEEVQKCIDEGGEEEDCIEKICTVPVPKTGVSSPLMGLVVLAVLVVGNVLIFRKREN